MTTNCEKRLSLKKKYLGVCMMAWLVLSPAALSVAESVTPSTGGDGGDPYTIGCGTQAMVGVQGTYYDVAGGVLGVIQAICVRLNADGSWNGIPAPAPGIAGRSTGYSRSLQCPQNQAVSGISGKSGWYVDQLRIYCAPLGEHGHLSGPGALLTVRADAETSEFMRHAAWIGGGGGSSFGPFLCPDNKPGKGFTGKAGEWVDRIALVCDYPTTAPPVVQSVSLSSNSVVGGTTVNGTVTLNATVLSGGRSVNLSTSNPGLASFPSNPITVPNGRKQAPTPTTRSLST